MDRTRVLIIGAGFGGLAAARALRKAPVDVTVIDRNNYHTFQPLLYQVATAGLEPGDIAYAVRGIFRKQKNVAFRLGEVAEVSLGDRFLWMSDGTRLQYDYLIVASGAETNDFGVEGVSQLAFGLKTMDDAVRIRNHILLQFELCNSRPELIDQGALTFVIVGGGPTGVEVAGALMELFDHVLRKDFQRMTSEPAQIILIEQGDRLLPSFGDRQSGFALKKLERWGVKVELGVSLVRVESDSCLLESGKRIDTKTVVWAAGVRGASPQGFGSVPILSGGRFQISANLSLESHNEVFVIGDLAGAQIGDSFIPQTALPAIQQGRHAGNEIRAVVRGKKSRPFKYRDLGQMATIGRHAAVVELPVGLKLRGYLAWMAWLFLHLIKLIGFRNRASVLVNWIWNYVTFDRTARLIFGHPAERGSSAKQAQRLVE